MCCDDASKMRVGGSVLDLSAYHDCDVAEDAVHADCAGADLLIVDPPRKGLCEGVREALVKGELDVKRLVYVSCGFDALERDQAALLNSRRWKLAHAEAHVFFPGSDHVETLAVYDAVAPE